MVFFMDMQLTGDYLRAEFPDLFKKFGEDLVGVGVRFVDRLVDPHYLVNFMQTLEINKLETQQREMGRRFFNKIMDSNGVVTSFTRHAYAGKLDFELSYEGTIDLLKHLRDFASDRIIGHLTLGSVEVVAQNYALKRLKNFDLPYVTKQVDDHGLLIAVKPHLIFADDFSVYADQMCKDNLKDRIDSHLERDVSD